MDPAKQTKRHVAVAEPLGLAMPPLPEVAAGDGTAATMQDAALRNGGMIGRRPAPDGLSASKYRTSLEDLMRFQAAEALRTFVAARFPHPDRTSPFQEVFEQAKALAFRIAEKSPYGSLTEAEYERRLKRAAAALVPPGKLLRPRQGLQEIAFRAVADIVGAADGQVVRIPHEWLAVLGPRLTLAVAGAVAGAEDISQSDRPGDAFEPSELPLPDFELVPSVNTIAVIRETAGLFPFTAALFSDAFTIVGRGLVDSAPFDLTPYVGLDFDDGDPPRTVLHPFGTIPMVPNKEVPFIFAFVPFDRDTIDPEDVEAFLTLALTGAGIALRGLSGSEGGILEGINLPSGATFRDAAALLEAIQKEAAYFNITSNSISSGIASFLNRVLGIENTLFTRYFMVGSYCYEKDTKQLALQALRAGLSRRSGLPGGRTVSYRYELQREATSPDIREPIFIVMEEQFGEGTQREEMRVFELPQGTQGIYNLDPGLTLKRR